jgi:chemotaxis protein MotB
VGGAYGNWELSTDRANVARREMQADGIRVNQISQVRGFADQRLHLVDKPFDPANRRVSLVVQNLNREEELLGTAKMVAERNEAEQKRGTSANVKAQRGGEEKPGKGSASPAEALATAETTKQTAAAGAALLEKSER